MLPTNKEIKTIKQQIISVLIIFFMFLMIFSTVKVGLAANTGDTNLVQNIVSGSLDMTAPDSLDWTDVTLNGSQQYSNVYLDGVNVVDYRGGDGDGWTLTVYANNLVAGTNNISIEARLNVDPGNITSDDGGTNASNFMMANNATTQSTLLSAAAGNGTGVTNIDNSLFKLNIEAGDAAGEYTAVMTFTVAGL